MSIAYFIGGLLPMIPYFAIADVFNAFYTSIGVTIAILLVFGSSRLLPRVARRLIVVCRRCIPWEWAPLPPRSRMQSCGP